MQKLKNNMDKNWKNDSIQFPRLIAELEALGAFTPSVMEILREEMDLTNLEICCLIDRAQSKWEAKKKKFCN